MERMDEPADDSSPDDPRISLTRETVDRLYRRWGHAVIAILRTEQGPDLAEDLAQQAWMNFYRAYLDGREIGERQVLDLVLRIARNAAISQGRKRSTRRKHGALEIAGEGSSLAIESVPAPDEPEDDKLPDLRDCFAKLDAESVRALRMRVLDGKSYREIAEELNIPENTVASRISRGKIRVRDCIESKR